MSSPAAPQTSRPGTDGEHALRTRRLPGDERQEFVVLHQVLLPRSAGDDQQIDRPGIRQTRVGHEAQAMVVAHGRRALPKKLERRIGQPGQDRKRAGQIDLIHPREHDRGDADVLLGWNRHQREPLRIMHGTSSGRELSGNSGHRGLALTTPVPPRGSPCPASRRSGRRRGRRRPARWQIASSWIAHHCRCVRSGRSPPGRPA